MKLKFNVESGCELAPELCRRLPGVSREKIKNQIKRGEVRVNGTKTQSDKPLYAGDIVEIFLPEKFAPSEIPIVYSDEFIVVVDKPPYTESEVQVPELVKNKTGRAVKAVHRLDTNTTGVLLTASCEESYLSLIEAFKNGQITKTYYARVFGCPEKRQDTLKAYLEKDARSSVCKVYGEYKRGAKEIITEYKVVLGGAQSVLMLKPVTGRTHQLRAHLAFAGFPIVGDGKYGNVASNRAAGAKIQKLRATQIQFGKLSAPLEYLSGKKISVPLGEDFADCK